MKPKMTMRPSHLVPLKFKTVDSTSNASARTVVVVLSVVGKPNSTARYGAAPTATAAIVTQSAQR